MKYLNINKKGKIFESKTLGYMLTFAAGLMSLYTFRLCGFTYSNGHTGNLLNASYNFYDNKPLVSIKFLLVIAFFSIGVIIAHLLRFLFNKYNIHYEYKRVALFLEILFTLIAFFVPIKYLKILCIAINLGIQIIIYDNIRNHSISTVNFVGNTKMAAEHIAEFLETRKKICLAHAIKYYMAFVFFILGGILACICVKRIGNYTAIVICIYMLFIILYTKVCNE